MKVQELFDAETSTLTYVVFDEATHDAVIIDPVLDFDPAAARTSTRSVEALLAVVRRERLKVHFVLETHAHADHVTAGAMLRRVLGCAVAIGARIVEVQSTFQSIFDLGPSFRPDGHQFDRLLREGETLSAGSLTVNVLETPGHTPACVSYRIGDAVFTGDALFIEDYGTGRCDFPRGDPDALYTSVHEKLYRLPDETRVYVGHDYQPGGRELRFVTTIGASKERNVQLRASTTREAYVRFRRERDATLKAPRLLYPSVQLNLAAGEAPPPHDNGRSYLSIPLDLAAPPV